MAKDGLERKGGTRMKAEVVLEHIPWGCMIFAVQDSSHYWEIMEALTAILLGLSGPLEFEE